MAQVRLLLDDDLDGLANPGEYVEAVRDGYAQRGRGAQTVSPNVTRARESPPLSLIHYSAVLPESGVMGGYMYTSGEESWYVTPLFDSDTGEPLALLDGARMNPIKTGAAGAIGVDALARPDACSLALLGSGMQARGQLDAIATVRDLDSVWVYSPTPDHRESFARTADRALDANVLPVDGVGEAIRDSDIVVTATNAAAPVFDGDLLSPGTHVNAVGGHGTRELDTATIQRAKYVPDLRERAIGEEGSFSYALRTGAVTEDHVHAELGEIVAGMAPGRESPDEITVFDSTGTAIETVASAYMLYEKAVERGLGSLIPFPSREDIYG